MPTKVTIELDHDGIRELLNCDGVTEACHQAAERIAEAAGDGFHVTRAYHPGSRAVYRVYGDSDEARIAEADDKVLSMAVSACRS